MGNKNLKKGIVAIEVMVIVVVLTIATTIAVPMFLQNYQVNRVNITRRKILNIKEAIIGVPKRLVEHTRTSFGFVGDLGVLPANLPQLRDGTGLPSFQIQNNVWFGYRGPYLEKDSDIIDAWGNPIIYTTSSETGVERELISTCDPDNPNDDIVEYIYNTEVSNFVHGSIFNSGDPATLNTAYSGPLNIYYPDGDNTLEMRTVQISSGVYDSTNESFPIPVGYRYFITTDSTYKKIASLNGYATLEESNGVVPPVYPGESEVNFYGDPTSPDAPFFERTFYNTDDTDPDSGSPINTLMGTWASDGNGNFWADGNGGEHRAAFGRADWDDYRLEVNATLHQGRGYGIYYRSDGQAAISGYCFQYDPGLTSGGRVAFVIRRIFNGGEQAPFQTRVMTLAEFPNVFNSSHQISITVEGSRHIIKVDGDPIFDFTDTAFMTGMPGLRSWDGNHYTSFHHLLVHEIPLPTISTGEFVWWSFEEGDGSTVYGSGFEVDAPEINGTLMNQSNIDRIWDNNNIRGKAIYADGGNNGYINLGDNIDLNPTDQFSISLWFKMPSINTNREYTLISKIQNGNLRGWLLDIKEVGSYSFSVNFTMRQNGNNNGRRIHVLNNTEILSNRWYHIVLTYDGSGFSGNTTIPGSRVKIYVTEISGSVTDPITTVITETLRASSNTANSGNLNFASYNNGNSRFEGYIDEIKIFYNTLTLAEVSDLFDKDK